jgi:type VI secretion system secreted protein VgrG
LVAVATPLGEDVLVFGRMTAHERLGRLFQFDLELFSENCEIKSKDVLGQAMGVRLELPGERGTRYFHGYVTDFHYRGTNRLRHGVYHATLRPWLWFLTRTADCRIFQNQKAPDIVKGIFAEHGFTDIEDKLSGSYRQWEYCVQYRETDFNFVSRLMEQEGCYYYFKHEKDKHILVLADGYSAHGKFRGYEQVPYFPPDAHDHRERDHLFELNLRASHQPGAYALNDFDFKVPSKKLLAKLADPKDHARAKFEIYDYPGEYTEYGHGEGYTRIRLEEVLAQHEEVEARGNAAGLAVGYLFDLTDCPRPDLNREYLIESATHQIESDAYESVAGFGGAGKLYRGEYVLLDAKQPYRAPRLTPKPVVQGPQTAIVVGPGGEEIYTDQYGRVKVQFHWDREGQRNESSSCWMRVSQVWAGKQWGAIHIPRIGQEVIVDFLEGDPDQPIITGRVYNGTNMPPYGLPGGKVISGIKSNSTKGGGGYNEYVFDDTKGNELIREHGQYDKDSTIEHDLREHVKNNRSRDVGVDETISIGNNRSKTVGKNETTSIGVNRSESVGKNEAISIGANRTEDVGENETISIGKNRTTDIGQNESRTVGKDETIQIGQNRKDTVGKNLTAEIGEKRQTQVGKDDLMQVGKKFYLEAGDEITLKTGSASLSMKKDGTIQIKGKDITIVGSGKIGIKASGQMTLKGSKIAEN